MQNIFQKGSSLLFQSLHNQSFKNFASKMQASSTQKTKDSAGKRLGVKKFGGHEVFPNDVIIRQRGFKFHPGKNVVAGRDHTIHAKAEGKVVFEKEPNRKKKRWIVSVIPEQNPNRLNRPPPPFMYHPELFPELSQSNPQPTNLYQPKPKQIKEKNQLIYGTKVEQPQHRVQVFVNTSNVNKMNSFESVDYQESIHNRMEHLESVYLNENKEENILDDIVINKQ